MYIPGATVTVYMSQNVLAMPIYGYLKLLDGGMLLYRCHKIIAN